jgi:hypothetical protein
VRDNRDPQTIGRALLERPNGDGAPLSQIYDRIDFSLVPSWDDVRDPTEPLCGYPTEGRRNLTNGRLER